MLSKFVIVCDEDVNIHDYSEVTWKVMNHVDPQRDVVITDGPLDILDHSCPQIGFGGKMGIDATRKGPGEGFHRQWPDEIKMDPAIRSKRWRNGGKSTGSDLPHANALEPMFPMWLSDILLILFLVLVNGFFSASEIALISLRKSRVRHLVKSGNVRARRVQRLQEDPERFLGTVQIGVTLVGSLASAIGGVIAVVHIKPLLQSLPVPDGPEGVGAAGRCCLSSASLRMSRS